MAKEQELLQRQIQTPTQAVKSSSAFEQLGEAAGQMGTLIASKVNAIAVEQAAQQGALAAEKGELPKDLAFPLTAATKAFNKAGAKIEADRMIISAQGQVQEALLNMTNPATFNRNTPAEFQATLEGIVQGTLENTRNENRAEVSSALLNVSSNASLKMLRHSIDFDNKQMKLDAENDLTGIQNALKNASIAGDTEQVNVLTELFHETLDNYSDMSEEIKKQAPFIRDKFQKAQTTNEILGNFSEAIANNTSAQFLNDFILNKQNLPFDQLQATAKELVQLDGTEKRLTQEIRAQEGQLVSNGIIDGQIKTVEDIDSFTNLSTLQNLQKQNELKRFQQNQSRSEATFLRAQRDLVQGNPTDVSGDTANKMLTRADDNFQLQNGRPMSLVEKQLSIEGKGDFPASGIKDVAMQRNVPAFDAKVTSFLTSGNASQTIVGASIYNDMVNVKENPNSINLTGDALDIATAYNTLNQGGTSQEEQLAVAKRVSDSVLASKEPEREVRRTQLSSQFSGKDSEKFKRSLFKDTFGVDYVPGISDPAMGVLLAGYKVSFMKHGLDEAAREANKYEMRAWGTDPHFKEGMVSSVTTKELSIAQIGNAFDNQFRFRLQEIINKNANITWQDEAQHIDLSQPASDKDKVFKLYGAKQGLSTLGLPRVEPRPRVKVNGQDTEVYLVPTADSRLGERFEWALFYDDKFGQPQPVPDNVNPSDVAHFAPLGLEQYAPTILESEQSERVKNIATEFVKKQAQAEWDNLGSKWLQGDLGDFLKFKKDPELASDIFRRMEGRDTEAVEKLLRQKIQGPQVLAELAANADNTGIAADTGKPQDKGGS